MKESKKIVECKQSNQKRHLTYTRHFLSSCIGVRPRRNVEGWCSIHQVYEVKSVRLPSCKSLQSRKVSWSDNVLDRTRGVAVIRPLMGDTKPILYFINKPKFSSLVSL